MAGKVVEKDRGLKKILRDVDQISGWAVTVGVHRENADDRPDSGDFSEIDNVALAAIHEFGAPGNTMFGHAAPIPERSFLRAGFDANVPKYVKLLLRGARGIVAGRTSVKRALALVGEAAVGDIVNLINAGIAPPNSPVTIGRKGSSKPLIDTGQMKQAIKPVVEKR